MKTEYKGIGSEYTSEEIIERAKKVCANLLIELDRWERIKDKGYSDEHKVILIDIENILTSC